MRRVWMTRFEAWSEKPVRQAKGIGTRDIVASVQSLRLRISHASVDIISCKPPTFTGGGTRYSISHQSDIHHAAITAVHMHNILTLDNWMQMRACYG